MGHGQPGRTPAQRRDAPQSLPAETGTSPDAQHPQPQLPLCISFEYRGRRVICRALRTEEGTITALTYLCPACGQEQKILPEIYVGPRIGLCVLDCVRCLQPGCELHVVIANGRATDAVGHN